MRSGLFHFWDEALGETIDGRGQRLKLVVKFEASGPVAQLDRASDFGSEGWGFESLRARHRLVPLSLTARL